MLIHNQQNKSVLQAISEVKKQQQQNLDESKQQQQQLDEIMSDDEIQKALYKLVALQDRTKIITPKIKQMINDLQKEMLKAEIDHLKKRT